ncbi:hypothetical protein IE53DRAFT_85643 [Violaceomyces palustris]|uniref:Uncharacterized protein n=1 Tax=Violaceomyces palustris TaxID=1673888 RepID=A0ACD0P771_9BASI|nr:hypothetical protein IE53DRAFT_85643 [Violaceomyces palustris]
MDDRGKEVAAKSSFTASTSPSSPIPSQLRKIGPGTPVLSRIIQLIPFAQGTYADVYGGTIQFAGEPRLDCVYKVNRPVKGPEFVRADEYDTSDHEEGGRIARFERELKILEELSSLQGIVVPLLLGTVRIKTISQPGLWPALILEDVGVPIDWESRWPSGLTNSHMRKLVEGAFQKLHDAGWLHGDVAPRNVLFATRPKSCADGIPDVRICLIDFSRAEEFDRSSARDLRRLTHEQEIIDSMLDDLFLPE